MFVILLPRLYQPDVGMDSDDDYINKIVFVKQASLVSSQTALRGRRGYCNVEPVIVSYGFLKNNSHPSSHETCHFSVFCLCHAGVNLLPSGQGLG